MMITIGISEWVTKFHQVFIYIYIYIYIYVPIHIYWKTTIYINIYFQLRNVREGLQLHCGRGHDEPITGFLQMCASLLVVNLVSQRM